MGKKFILSLIGLCLIIMIFNCNTDIQIDSKTEASAPEEVVTPTPTDFPTPTPHSPTPSIIPPTSPPISTSIPVPHASRTPMNTPVIQATLTPSPTPVIQATLTPSPTPVIQPTITPKLTPVIQPMITPNLTPVIHPIVTPSLTPIIHPTVSPSLTPITQPTVSPSLTPITQPTVTPGLTPVAQPTVTPSVTPISQPTVTPSLTPIIQPTVTPSITPDIQPTATVLPTSLPSLPEVTNVIAQLTTNNNATPTQLINLTWEKPADTNYDSFIITYEPNGGSPIEVGKETTTYTFPELPYETSYTFTVKTADNTGRTSTGTTATLRALTFTFTWGDPANTYANIYALWLENTHESFIQNVTLCNRLIYPKGGTSSALAYWRTMIQGTSDTNEIDAVTSATLALQDFSVTTILKDSRITTFTVYFEIDHSFDTNDWFSDQPGLVYTATIDLASGITEYPLHYEGWAAMSDKFSDPKPFTPFSAGRLYNTTVEKQYITHKRVTGTTTISTTDTINTATKMVESATITIQ